LTSTSVRSTDFLQNKKLNNKAERCSALHVIEAILSRFSICIQRFLQTIGVHICIAERLPKRNFNGIAVQRITRSRNDLFERFAFANELAINFNRRGRYCRVPFPIEQLSRDIAASGLRAGFVDDLGADRFAGRGCSTSKFISRVGTLTGAGGSTATDHSSI